VKQDYSPDTIGDSSNTNPVQERSSTLRRSVLSFDHIQQIPVNADDIAYLLEIEADLQNLLTELNRHENLSIKVARILGKIKHITAQYPEEIEAHYQRLEPAA